MLLFTYVFYSRRRARSSPLRLVFRRVLHFRCTIAQFKCVVYAPCDSWGAYPYNHVLVYIVLHTSEIRRLEGRKLITLGHKVCGWQINWLGIYIFKQKNSMLNRNVHVPKLNGADNGKAYVYFVWDYFVGALCRYAHYRWFMRGIHEEVAQYDLFLYFQQQMIFFLFHTTSTQTFQLLSNKKPHVALTSVILFQGRHTDTPPRNCIPFVQCSRDNIDHRRRTSQFIYDAISPRFKYASKTRGRIAVALLFLYGYVCAHCRRSPRVWWVWAPLFQLNTPDGRLSCDVFLCSGSSANFVHQATRRWFNQFESIRKSFAMRQVVWAALVVVANLEYLMFVHLKNACCVWFESFWGAPD